MPCRPSLIGDPFRAVSYLAASAPEINSTSETLHFRSDDFQSTLLRDYFSERRRF